MQPAPFTHSVLAFSLQVAGLMTTEMIQRRVSVTGGVNRVMVPGRCRGDLAALSAHFGVPFVRGPDEIKDLPRFFGREAAPIDLSRHDARIFAEIVDAPIISLAVILERAKAYQSAGADVVDLGCLPQTPFAHLEDVFAMLHAAGFVVSVDSMDGQELLRAGRAGADFLLSLKEETLWIADEVAATPSDMASLYRAIETMERMGRDYRVGGFLPPQAGRQWRMVVESRERFSGFYRIRVRLHRNNTLPIGPNARCRQSAPAPIGKSTDALVKAIDSGKKTKRGTLGDLRNPRAS